MEPDVGEGRANGGGRTRHDRIVPDAGSIPGGGFPAAGVRFASLPGADPAGVAALP